MSRILKTAVVAATLALPGAGAVAVAAPAPPGPAAVVVTIKAEGTDLSGEVRSLRLACKSDRTVVVFKQIGRRGGGNDQRFASDTSGLQGGKWVWSTGNTGTEGRFYAKVKARPGCKVAVSKTIRATRND